MVNTLVLLGCNAGHYDYVWSNVAYAFCKKISGCVIASDGTVCSGPYNKIKTTSAATSFDSHNKGGFGGYRAPGSTRDNIGWVIYKYGRSSCKAYWFSGALGKILKVANLVESKEYFASYK